MPIQTKNRIKKDSSSSRWNTRYCKLFIAEESIHPRERLD
jgi:hypothetical protein